jgi:hypothetical protein
MASTFTRQQAADAVAAARTERDTIRANLFDLDSSFGKPLLAGAALTGTTRQQWDSAAGSLAALWELYEAYAAVIDRAAETLAGRPGQKQLAEITVLLTGPSIELHRPAPLGRRDLADTGREQLTLAAARAQMRSAFAEVTGLVPAAEEAWNDVAGRLDAAAEDLRGVDPLGDEDLAGEVSAVRAELDWLRGLLNTDPLGSASAASNFRDTERTVAALLSRRDELRGLLDAYKAKAARVGGAEDPHLAARYAQARELLWTAPCDLTAAAGAVNGCQQAVLVIGAQRR